VLLKPVILRGEFSLPVRPRALDLLPLTLTLPLPLSLTLTLTPRLVAALLAAAHTPRVRTHYHTFSFVMCLHSLPYLFLCHVPALTTMPARPRRAASPPHRYLTPNPNLNPNP